MGSTMVPLCNSPRNVQSVCSVGGVGSDFSSKIFLWSEDPLLTILLFRSGTKNAQVQFPIAVPNNPDPVQQKGMHQCPKIILKNQEFSHRSCPRKHKKHAVDRFLPIACSQSRERMICIFSFGGSCLYPTCSPFRSAKKGKTGYDIITILGENLTPHGGARGSERQREIGARGHTRTEQEQKDCLYRNVYIMHSL